MDLNEMISTSRSFVDELEKHRSPWESQTHWIARKNFLRQHWQTFEDKTRLICLSQAWANVHFSGNRYNDAVMQTLEEMEADLDPADKMLRHAEIQVMAVPAVPELKTEVHNKIKKLPHHIPDAIAFIKQEQSNSKESTKRKSTEETPNIEIKKVKMQTINPLEMLSSLLPKIQPKVQEPMEFPTVNQIIDKNTMILNDLKTLSAEVRKNLYLLNRPHKKTHAEVLKQCIKDCNISLIYRCELVDKRLDVFNQWKSTKKKLKIDFTIETFVCEISYQNIFLAQGYGIEDQETSKENASMKVFQLLTNKNIFIGDGKRMVATNRIATCKVLSTNELNGDHVDLPPTLTPKDFMNTESNNVIPLEKLINIKDSFVIREVGDQNPISILVVSADFNKSKVWFDFTTEYLHEDVPLHKCTVMLDGDIICTEAGASKQLAKKLAAKNALDKLKGICPTVTIDHKKQHKTGKNMTRNNIIESQQLGTEIGSDNVGNRMLRKMGWSGFGGLGKDGKGISKPVEIEDYAIREGIGASSEKLISARNAKAVIENYLASHSQDVLTFTPNLSKEERASIHQMASRYGLQSKSFNDGQLRYLVVQRKLTAKGIMQDLIWSGGQKSGVQLTLPKM